MFQFFYLFHYSLKDLKKISIFAKSRASFIVVSVMLLGFAAKYMSVLD